MDRDLAQRLRRYGEQVDQAAIAAQETAVDPTDELPTVVPILAARSNRRWQMISAVAAATIVVLAGALVTWRIAGRSDPGPAAVSTQVPVDTTAPPTSSATTTTVPRSMTTTVPMIGPAGSSTTSSSTTTTTDAPDNGPSGSPATNRPACEDYTAYGQAFPIRLCHRGPAVSLIQQHTGAPADGFFGPETRQAVRVFQQQNGLNVDGLVGRDTWAAMFPFGAPGTDADGNGTVEPWELD